jgi:hypothetical protein
MNLMGVDDHGCFCILACSLSHALCRSILSFAASSSCASTSCHTVNTLAANRSPPKAYIYFRFPSLLDSALGAEESHRLLSLKRNVAVVFVALDVRSRIKCDRIALLLPEISMIFLCSFTIQIHSTLIVVFTLCYYLPFCYSTYDPTIESASRPFLSLAPATNIHHATGCPRPSVVACACT